MTLLLQKQCVRSNMTSVYRLHGRKVLMRETSESIVERLCCSKVFTRAINPTVELMSSFLELSEYRKSRHPLLVPSNDRPEPDHLSLAGVFAKLFRLEFDFFQGQVACEQRVDQIYGGRVHPSKRKVIGITGRIAHLLRGDGGRVVVWLCNDPLCPPLHQIRAYEFV